MARAPVRVLGIFVCTWALGCGGDPAPESDGPVARPVTTARAVGAVGSPELRRAFPDFTRRSRPDDTLGVRNRGGGLRWDDATVRRVPPVAPLGGAGGAPTAETFLATNREDEVCLLVLPRDAGGPTGRCQNVRAVEGKAWFLTLEDADGGVQISGIVPARVERVIIELADGRRTTLASHGRVVSGLLPSRPRSVSYREAGRTTVQRLR